MVPGGGGWIPVFLPVKRPTFKAPLQKVGVGAGHPANFARLWDTGLLVAWGRVRRQVHVAGCGVESIVV